MLRISLQWYTFHVVTVQLKLKVSPIPPQGREQMFTLVWERAKYETNVKNFTREKNQSREERSTAFKHQLGRV